MNISYQKKTMRDILQKRNKKNMFCRLILFLLGFLLTSCNINKNNAVEEKTNITLQTDVKTEDKNLKTTEEKQIFKSRSGIPSEPPVFIGTWKVMRYVSGCYLGLDTDEKNVEKFIDKEIYIGPDQITIDGKEYNAYSIPSYWIDIMPVSEVSAYRSSGWSFTEKSWKEFLGYNSNYYICVTTNVDFGDGTNHDELDFFIKDKNTMIAHINAGAVELKRIHPQKKAEQVTNLEMYITGSAENIYEGEWEISDYLGNRESGEISRLIGKRIKYMYRYVETENGLYEQKETIQGNLPEHLYEINILSDNKREVYDMGDEALREKLWDTDKDYFAVVRMSDWITEKDDILGDLIIKDKKTMYLYNQYGIFQLRRIEN